MAWRINRVRLSNRQRYDSEVNWDYENGYEINVIIRRAVYLCMSVVGEERKVKNRTFFRYHKRDSGVIKEI